uniref:Growth-regulating factor n=2 Tax=Musa acuminata TaxID=4641 RepID=A0A804HUE6_MUSAM
MMMMVVGGGSRYPFTASQWQELELQALIFKYMVSGIPVPPDLILCIRRSLFVEPQTLPFLPHRPTVGWEAYQVGDGRKAVDPEPGRCRRTDGKKWRCSKEAFPDSKYCERHMHRGKSRSRKPVELSLATTPISSHFPPPTA